MKTESLREVKNNLSRVIPFEQIANDGINQRARLALIESHKGRFRIAVERHNRCAGAEVADVLWRPADADRH